MKKLKTFMYNTRYIWGVVLLLPFVLGLIFYYLSKVFRSLGYFLMIKPKSALNELTDFLSIKSDWEDD